MVLRLGANESPSFGNTDFAAIAHSFGVRGIRAERPDDIAPALHQAIDAEETVVIDVVTSIDARAPEAWLPEQA